MGKIIFVIFFIAVLLHNTTGNPSETDMMKIFSSHDFNEVEVIPMDPRDAFSAEFYHLLPPQLIGDNFRRHLQKDSGNVQKRAEKIPKRSKAHLRRSRDPSSSGSLTENGDLSSTSLQNLEQMRRAIRAWEAKLAKFSDKFGNNQEVLKNNPVWNKLLMILSSLVQLAEAEEMRLSVLYETRM